MEEVEDEDAIWRTVPPPEVPRKEPDIPETSEFYAKISSVFISEIEKGGAHFHVLIELSNEK